MKATQAAIFPTTVMALSELLMNGSPPPNRLADSGRSATEAAEEPKGDPDEVERVRALARREIDHGEAGENKGKGSTVIWGHDSFYLWGDAGPTRQGKPWWCYRPAWRNDRQDQSGTGCKSFPGSCGRDPAPRLAA